MMLEARRWPRVPTFTPVVAIFGETVWTPARNTVRLRKAGLGAFEPTGIGEAIGERRSKAVAKETLIREHSGAHQKAARKQPDS